MPLLIGVGILALAVVLGGLGALLRGRASRFMGPIRTFAVVAAAAVALLHLLPEAIAAIGWRALFATGAGLLFPSLLEKAFPVRGGHEHRAPTTALAMGYAAVIAHQLGEGAAVATLARTGALSPSIVLAIAAHTVPLAMVVAIGVIEANGRTDATAAARDATVPTLLALSGVAAATAVGAAAGSVLSGAYVEIAEPWALATIAGLLLHALAHDAFPAHTTTRRARVIDASAGLGGLLIAAIGIEESGWIHAISWPLRGLGLALSAGIVIARSFISRSSHHHHD